MPKCSDCGGRVKKAELYEDPRDPPLEVDECLCRGCWDAAIYDEIEEHRNEIARLEKLREKEAP